MTKVEFLQKLHDGRAAWDALLDQVAQAAIVQPEADDSWSVGDLIVHVTWHEQEIIGVLNTRALVGSELWLLPTAERNQAIYEANRTRPLADVLAEAKAAGPPLLQAAAALTDEALNDPAAFQEMPSDFVPWQVIASNTFTHYPEHITDIQARLGQTPMP